MAKRTVAARSTRRLVSRANACEALGCSARTFWRKWNVVFTETRPPEERGRRFDRKVFSDELAAAVEGGAAAVQLVQLLNKRVQL